MSDADVVAGVRLATAACGLKRNGRNDLALIELAPGSVTAAVFTRNAFCAAPVEVARRNLVARPPRALLVNAGNANCGTGAQGLAAADECCRLIAAALDCDAAEVLPFSTGVIGEPLAVDRVAGAIPALAAGLDPGAWPQAAQAIMTTDTRPKLASRRVSAGEATLTLTGIAKGSGMIRPDMATMLAFVATDAAVTPAALQALLQRAVRDSFNAITVDGDTSTNDACTLTATGASGVELAPESAHWAAFEQALCELCADLAQALIADAEGATKFVTVSVSGGAQREECRTVAYAIAESPLVKTALFASDANWGRILAAIGRAGVSDLDVSAVTIDLDGVRVVSGGGRDPNYTESAGQEVMARSRLTVHVDLGRGAAAARVWTCDLSLDYVRINADYRS